MIEMTELAEILDSATTDSLVLLDEVGRGTSTADGLAIARAVTEFLHDEVGATTLFATHHHDLTGVAEDREGVFNRHFRTRQEGGEVVFEHAVEPGAASASYGVEVAGVAGVADPVVDRAAELLEGERDTAVDDGGDGGRTADAAMPDERTNGHREDAGDAAAVAERLRAVNVAELTPIEALNTLAELQSELE